MKRFFLWLVGIVIVLVGVIALAFHLSPWPSAFLIAQMFSGGDTASEAALEKHVPPGIAAKKDVAYGHEPDEVLDIYFPKARSPLPAIVWVHGGGWIGGSKDGVANYLKILAGEGYTTVGVEYSTGFGWVYPKPVRQINEALGYLVKNAGNLNIDPRASCCRRFCGSADHSATCYYHHRSFLCQAHGHPSGTAAGKPAGTFSCSPGPMIWALWITMAIAPGS